jgi:hypothetical protein
LHVSHQTQQLQLQIKFKPFAVDTWAYEKVDMRMNSQSDVTIPDTALIPVSFDGHTKSMLVASLIAVYAT